jgi:hypothetical protein
MRTLNSDLIYIYISVVVQSILLSNCYVLWHCLNSFDLVSLISLQLLGSVSLLAYIIKSYSIFTYFCIISFFLFSLYSSLSISTSMLPLHPSLISWLMSSLRKESLLRRSSSLSSVVDSSSDYDVTIASLRPNLSN